MMYHWTPDMIRFMKDASEYGSFSRELGELVQEELGTGLHICDAGCGLGYLSLELSAFSAYVTAVDINPDALQVLRENIVGRGIGNIRVLEEDIFRKPEEGLYDGMVFCFMGDIREVAEAGKRLCRGKLLMISKNYTNHRFSARTHAANQYEAPEVYLQSRGVPCRHRELEIEYGQPFRSLSDAMLFYRIYSVDQDKNLITERFVREKLTETKDPVFPLYLPHRRRMAMTVWNAADLP